MNGIDKYRFVVSYLEKALNEYDPQPSYRPPNESERANPTPAPVDQPLPPNVFIFTRGSSASSLTINNNSASAASADAIREQAKVDKEKEKDKQNTNAAWLGEALLIAGSGGLAALLAFRKKDQENRNKDQQNYTNVCELKDRISNQALDDGLGKDIMSFINIDIENKKFCAADKSRNFIYLATTGLIEAGTLFIGGMYEIAWLVTAAKVTLVMTAAVAIFALVWYALNEVPAKPTPELIRKVRHSIEILKTGNPVVKPASKSVVQPEKYHKEQEIPREAPREPERSTQQLSQAQVPNEPPPAYEEPSLPSPSFEPRSTKSIPRSTDDCKFDDKGNPRLPEQPAPSAPSASDVSINS